MNLHLIGETLLLLTAAFIQIREKPIRVVVGMSAVAFLTIIGIQWIRTGIGQYFHMADVSACLIMTMFFSYILYKAIVDRKKDRRNVAVILMCIGVLIYFGCSVPLMALINVIHETDPEASNFLFVSISDVVANLRYLFLAAAFLTVSRTNYSF